MKSNMSPTKYCSKNRKSSHSNDTGGIKQGRIEKRPAVKLRKKKQKAKNLSIKTNKIRKDLIQVRKKN